MIDPAFDWEGDRPPGTPWSETVIYEAHVAGFTRLNPAVSEELRGTYAGLASEESIGYLCSLGVTAVELLPVHHFLDEAFLDARGLTNYWGYSSIGFFAPHALYAASGRHGQQVAEFKEMVKALHRAGLEVILDVVYNHSAEGDHHGPALAFRGIDNASYYRLDPWDLGRYVDVTGTGNSLNVAQPDVLRLVMDSLRYWAEECHVDGFRFDLAAALAREQFDVDPGAAFLDAIHQDPVLSQLKLIAEPWDLGPGGHQTGRFPGGWSEWNDAYRDTMRDFWRGRASLADFASRFTGSSDLFAAAGRPPAASINFVTAHDGFTLADLVSYETKHNEANLEGNADGTDDNRSWNHGVEGPSADPAISELRLRQQRNFLATLFLSQGVPMLVAGDERCRSQGGNNNAWCQDNETSWLDWEPDEQRDRQVAFTKRVIELRSAHPVFRRTLFLADGENGAGLPQAWWFGPDGRQLQQQRWHDDGRALGVFLNGSDVGGDSFVVLVNAGEQAVGFTLPPPRFGRRWLLELATADLAAPPQTVAASGSIEVDRYALSLLRCER